MQRAVLGVLRLCDARLLDERERFVDGAAFEMDLCRFKSLLRGLALAHVERCAGGAGRRASLAGTKARRALTPGRQTRSAKCGAARPRAGHARRAKTGAARPRAGHARRTETGAARSLARHARRTKTGAARSLARHAGTQRRQMRILRQALLV